MKRSCPRSVAFVFLGALLLALAIYPLATASGPDPAVKAAWERVQEAGSYRFLSSIDQTLVPRPIPEMIGEQEERLTLTTKGAVQLPDRAYLEMWAENGAIQTPPVVLLRDRGQTFLQEEGKVTPVDDPISTGAPSGDWLSYLVAAKNVQLIEPTLAEAGGLTGFRFEIDGRLLAEHVRQQAENMLRQDPKAPLDLSVAPSALLQRLSGQGELWVGAEGLPRRQILDLSLPEISSAYDARMRVVVDLSDFGQVESLPHAVPDEDGGWIVQQIEPAQPPPASRLPSASPGRSVLLDLVLFSLCLIGLAAAAALYQRRPKQTYAFIVVAIILIMVVTPPLESAQAAQFFEGQAQAVGSDASARELAAALGLLLDTDQAPARAAVGLTSESEIPPADPAGTATLPLEAVPEQAPPSLSARDAAPKVLPWMAPGQAGEADPIMACGDGDPTHDADQDGLNDQVEGCLGTDPYAGDSDGDGLADKLEIDGFDGWATNPLEIDSNHDGLMDLVEWPLPEGGSEGGLAPVADIDGDGTPNVWDDDNDGDGVLDSIDLSPMALTASYTDTFDLTIEQDSAFKGYQYVEFQLQPEDPAHLRYTTTALDWPLDEEGNMQDRDDSADDIRLSPALLIASNVDPGADLAAKYGLHVWPAEDGEGYDLLAPLFPVGTGGAILAFQSKVAYGPDVTDFPAIQWQDARLVWLVQAQVEDPAPRGAVLHRFEEPFRLTGLQVTKSDDYEFAIFGTPQSRQEDAELFKLQIGLDATFMSYERLEFQGLDQTALEQVVDRFGGSYSITYTWGVNLHQVDVERRHQAHGHHDAGAASMGQVAAALLESHFAGNQCGVLQGREITCGSLVLAYEEDLGVADLGDMAAPNSESLRLNLRDIPIQTLRGVRLSMYERLGPDDWQVMGPDRMLAIAEGRYGDHYDSLVPEDVPYLGTEGMRFLTFAAYLGANTGSLVAIQIDGTTIVPDLPDESGLMNNAWAIGTGYWSPAKLSSDLPELIANALQSQFRKKPTLKRMLTLGPDDILAYEFMERHSRLGTVDKWVGNGADAAAFGVSLWGLVCQGASCDGDTETALAISTKVMKAVAVPTGILETWKAAIPVIGQLKHGLKTGESLTKGAKVAGVVGLVIGIGMTWASFGMTWASTQRDEVRQMALAMAIVTTVWMTVVFFINFIPVFGQLISAILSLIDVLISFISMIFGEDWSVARILTELFYSVRQHTEPVGSPSITGWRSGIGPGDPGLLAGSSFEIRAAHSGRMRKTGDGSYSDLDRSYVKGVMAIRQPSAVAGRQMNEPYTCIRDGIEIECSNTIGAYWAGPLPAGLNIPLTYELWSEYQYRYGEYGLFGLVRWNTKSDTLQVPEDPEPTTLYLDILPATLSLLWAGFEGVTNPDQDGDNLRDELEWGAGCDASQRNCYCTDPGRWDTDEDGLSDGYEVDQGTDPCDPDTDHDGLPDGRELVLGTGLNQSDTDKDGLSDGEEVEGWVVIVPGGFETEISSDPLEPDADGDGLNDLAERENSFSPYAFNRGPELQLKVAPFGIGSNDNSGVYVDQGEALTVQAWFYNGSAGPISSTLSLCLPNFIGPAGIAFDGDRKPQHEAGTCPGGTRYDWSFRQQPLQPLEGISTTLTAQILPVTGTTAADVWARLELDDATILEERAAVVVDRDAPGVTFEAPTAGAAINGENLVIGGTAGDPTSWVDRVELDLPGYSGLAEGASPWAFTWSLPGDGQHTLLARAYDHVGNSSSTTVVVTVDNTPPTVTLTTPDHVRSAGGAVLLEGTANDATSGLSRVQISINHQPWRSAALALSDDHHGTWSYEWQVSSTAQGGHSIRARAVDQAGNICEPVDETVVIDQAPPGDALADATYLHAPPAAAVGQAHTLTGVADEGAYLPRPSHPALQALQDGQQVPGPLDVFDDANIWLGLSTIFDNDQGAQAAWLGDFDNDRMADLAVGLPSAAEGAGQVIVVHGRAGDWAVPPDLELLAESNTVLTGAPGAGLGAIVAAGGDANGDSLADLLVGERGSQRAFLVYGRTYPLGWPVLDPNQGPLDLITVLHAPDPITGLVAAGDTNDDGLDDMLIASGAQTYLLLGESVVQSEIDVAAVASLWEDDLPASGPGDVNGDGQADRLEINDGQACLILGDGDACAVTVEGVAGAATAPYAAGSDLNGDGSSDLLLLPSRQAAEARGLDYGEASLVSTDALPRAAVGASPAPGLSVRAPAAGLAPAATADTFYVDDDDPGCGGGAPCYDQIPLAIAAADDAGDTIVVGPGVYPPFAIGPGKDHLTVRGVNADAVFVDGGGSAPYAVQISHAVGISLTQMTLRNAERGVWLENAGHQGDITPSHRISLDHLLVHSVEHALYMDHQSTAVVRHGTLAGSGIGAQPMVVVAGTPDAGLIPEWEQLASIPTSAAPVDIQEGGALVRAGEILYALPGGGSTAVYWWDGTEWQSAEAPAPITQRSAAAGSADGTLWLLTGGAIEGSERLDAFDNGAWESVPAPPIAPWEKARMVSAAPGQIHLLLDDGRFVEISAPGPSMSWSYLKPMAWFNAYVADGEAGLRVVNVSDPANPTEVGFADASGIPLGVAVAGDTVYMVDGEGGLKVMDASEPATLKVVGSFDTPGTASAVAVAGGYAFVADGDAGLRVVDVHEPGDLTEVGSLDTPGNAQGVALAGDYAYVADGNGGLRVVNISDRSHLEEAGSLDTPLDARRVAVAGNHAYVVDGNADLRVVNVSDPNHLKVAGSFETPGSWGQGVAVSGDYAYVVDGYNLWVVDVTDPSTPTQAGFLPGGTPIDVVVAGDYAYLSPGEGSLRVVNITDPMNPFEVGSYDTPSSYGRGAAVAGNRVYAIDRYGLRVLDVSQPSTPIEIGSYDSAGHASDVTVVGDYAYVADGMAGLRVVDVRAASNPSQVGSLDMPGEAIGVAVVGDFAYVASLEAGLRVVDVSDPSQPEEVGLYSPPDGVKAVVTVGNVAYVTGGRYSAGRLSVLDLGNPISPTVLLSIDTAGSAEHVAVAGNYAYVADGTAGLRVWDIEADIPDEVGVYDPWSFYAEAVAVRGDHAYVAGGGDLTVIDVSNPDNLVLKGQVASVGSASSVALAGDHAYLAAGDAGLRVVDVSDPGKPYEVGFSDTPGYSQGVEVHRLRSDFALTWAGGYLYTFRGSTLHRYDPNTDVWTALTSLPATITVGSGVTMAPDRDTNPAFLYLMAGGGDDRMVRYDVACDTWDTSLPDPDQQDPEIRFRVDGGSGLVSRDGHLLLYSHRTQGSNFNSYGELRPPATRLTFAGTALVDRSDQNVDWQTLVPVCALPDFRIELAADNAWVSQFSRWGPDPDAGWGKRLTLSEASFVAHKLGAYRVGADSQLQAGYYAYHDDAYVFPSRQACLPCEWDASVPGSLVWGETAFGSIQAAIDSGATRVLVRPGVYPGPAYLVSGVEVLGAGAELSVAEAPEGLRGPLVRGEGIAAASVANLTLAGNGGTTGLHVQDGALGIRLARCIVRDQGTGVLVNDANLEVVNNTIVDNVNGMRVTKGAPLNVRNTIFAFNSGTGLDYSAAGAVSNTYNDFWANGDDLHGDEGAAGGGNLFLDPLLVSPLSHNYRLGEWSPAIDAGDPSDEAPPGTGQVVDIGYREYGRASYYADDDYGPNQLNDGLTWGVDAFDTIGGALAAAADDIPVLAGGSPEGLRLSVGVGAGTYEERVKVPSYVHLIGSGAGETTINAGDEGSPVTFDGVVQAEVTGFTLTGAGDGASGVLVDGASNTIGISRNIITANGDGILFYGRSSGSVSFNTIAANSDAGLRRAGAYTWLEAENNIVFNNGVGLQGAGTDPGLFHNTFNLVYSNGSDFVEVEPGEGTIREWPAFAAGYNLSADSPAVDAASPFAAVPPGGGVRADMGYKELLASPLVLFFGPEIHSTVTANSGVAGVEVGVTPLDPGMAPSLPLTETLPADWHDVTLREPGGPYSLWTYPVTPTDTRLYRVYSRATDVLGNAETDETVWYAGAFVGDDAPPVVSWVTPTGDVTTEAAALELVARASDYIDDGQGPRFNVSQVYFDVDGRTFPAEWAGEVDWQPSSGLPRTFRAWIPLETGSYRVRAVAVDGAGHTSQTVRRRITVNAAGAPGVATVTSHADGQAVNETELELAGYVRFDAVGADREVQCQVGSEPALAASLADPDALISAWVCTATLPAVDGPHHITVSVNDHATDLLSVLLDRQPPSLTVVTPQPGDYVTRTVTFEATADDAESGLAAVQVSMDGGYTWRPSEPAGSVWTLAWDLTGWQDFASHPAVARAVDMAGNETRLALPVTVDNQPPTGMDPVTFTPEPGSHVATGTTLGIAWEPAADASGQVTVLLDLDQEPETAPSQPVAGNTYSTPLAAVGQWYVHLAAQDAAGNQILRHYGPWYVDEMQLDGYIDAPHNEWRIASDLLDDDERPARTQNLFVTWDSQALYLGLQGAWWPLDGTLWAYLGPSASSTPRVDGQGVVPLAATRAIEVIDSETGWLWSRAGGAWSKEPLEFAHGSGGDTEVRLPWTGSAYLIAFVLGKDGAPRSVFPTTNPLLGPWTEPYGWTSLSLPPTPNDGQPQAESIALSISSPQEGHAHWGPGDELTYRIKVENHEASALTGLQLLLSATSGLGYQVAGGAGCDSCPAGGQTWALSIPYLAAKSSHVVTVSGQLAGDLASLEAVTTTAVIPVTNLGFAQYSHRVDGRPPSVTINVPQGNGIKAGAGVAVSGTALDGTGSGVSQVEVRPAGGSWQPAKGRGFWTAQVNVPSTQSHYSLEVRATDQAGNESVVGHEFIVDETPPTLSFSLPLTLTGEYAVLAGTAQDPAPDGSLVARVDVQVDHSAGLWRPGSRPLKPGQDGAQAWAFTWALPREDNVTHRLRARAYDLAGNETQTGWEETIVDNVAPVVMVTKTVTALLQADVQAGAEAQGAGPLLAGTARDGAGVRSVTILVYAPDGRAYRVPAERDGDRWQYLPGPEISRPGSYALRVEATDVNGNVAIAGPFGRSPDRRLTAYLPVLLRSTVLTPPAPDCYPALWLAPAVGNAPHGVAVDGVGQRLYVANYGDDTLSILSTLSYETLGTVAVGHGPNGVAYNPLNGLVYVANRNSNSVSLVRASDHKLLRTIPVGTQPNGVAVDLAHNAVYVTNYRDGTVSVIDSKTHEVARTLAVGAEPAMIAIHQGRSKAYVSLHGAGAVAAIDAAGQVTTINVHASGPYGVAVDEARDLVYVAAIDSGRVAVVDAATDTFLDWAEIRRSQGGNLVPLRQIAVNPEIGTSGHIYVTTTGTDGGYDRVLMLPKGWSEGFGRPRALPLNEPREGIAFEPASQRLYVPSRANNQVAVILDGEPECPSNFSMGEEYEISQSWQPPHVVYLPLVVRSLPQ